MTHGRELLEQTLGVISRGDGVGAADGQWRTVEEIHAASVRSTGARWTWGSIKNAVKALCEQGLVERRWRGGRPGRYVKMEYRIAVARGAQAACGAKAVAA